MADDFLTIIATFATSGMIMMAVGTMLLLLH